LGQCDKTDGLLTILIMFAEDYIISDGRSMAQRLTAGLSPRNFRLDHRAAHLDLTAVRAIWRQALPLAIRFSLSACSTHSTFTHPYVNGAT